MESDIDAPKYINSTESIIYHKSKTLYGLNFAKKSIQKKEFCYLTEGYTDVIAFHHSGLDNTVSTCGTSLTEDHVKILGRITKKVIIAFDGDEAGYKASERAIELLFKSDIFVEVIKFENGDDPHSVFKEVGEKNLENFIKERYICPIKFLIDRNGADKSEDILKKTEGLKKILKIIAGVQSKISQDLYLSLLSNYLKIEKNIILQDFIKISSKKSATVSKNKHLSRVFKNKVNIDTSIKNSEKKLLEFLILYGSHKYDSRNNIYDHSMIQLKDYNFFDPICRSIMEILSYSSSDTFDSRVKKLVYNTNKEIQREVIDFMAEKKNISKNWEKKGIYTNLEVDNLSKSLDQHLSKLKLKNIQKMIIENQDKLKGQNLSNEEELNVYEVLNFLKKIESEVMNKLGIVLSTK